MDIFEGPYFNINRRLFIIFGLWPYENSRTNTLKRLFFMSLLFALCMPQLISALVHHEDIDRMMLSMLVFFTVISTWLKMFGLVIRQNKLKVLFEAIAHHWQMIQNENERQILREYSDKGRLLTILYIAFISNSCVNMCLAIPLAPKFLDAVHPLQEPRPKTFLTQGEYFIDRETNFVLPMILDVGICSLGCVTVVAFNTMYIVSCQQCCALYAIVRYRLLNLKRMVITNPLTNEDGDTHDSMIEIIQLHQTALKFTSIVDNSFSVTFLFILMVYVILIPLTACAIIANLGNLIDLFPYAVFFGMCIVNLFVTIWPGQTIYDHGISLHEGSYYNEWYTTPLGTKKLLHLFMLRCSQPAMLTAGGILELNFVTYSVIMRTAISYITVAASFR